MPSFSTETEEKITLLRGLRALGTTIEVHELVQVDWPSPDGTIYYSVLQTDQVATVPPPVSPIEARLIPDGSPNWFLPIDISSDIGDEEVDLTFWDNDEDISGKLNDYGEGIKATMLYWFPQVELLLDVWHGHLEYGEHEDVEKIVVKAVQGFRSADANVPGRAHYQHCSAVFGGLLDTQDEIDEHDCPYNFHIGGLIGNNNPATGLPWTFCDRRDRSSCTARAVNPLFHLSHNTVTNTILNPSPGGGPMLTITSHGNETNLKEPVRVVMGSRRVYDMRVLAYSRQNPGNAGGGFSGIYEGVEGPIGGFSQTQVTVGGKTQNINPQHFLPRLGAKGQTNVADDMTAHSYSGTSLFLYRFYYTDPANLGADDASATSHVDGLNNIRIYAASASIVIAGAGTPIFNNTLEQASDVNGRTAYGSGLSCSWSGSTWQLKFAGDLYYESADDVPDPSLVTTWVVVDGDMPLPLVTAGESSYDYAETSTTNRAWQIARALCDKRWGYGLDYARLNKASWIAAAEWVAPSVRYTDPDGNQWDHIRGESNVELVGKKVQQQIDDLCMAGRLSRPFLFNGEIHIVPLRALTDDELDECPVFTDEGDDRNIIWNDGKSSLEIGKRKSVRELINRVECTFDNAANAYLQTPLRPVEDVDAQLAAGRLVGDFSRKVNNKQYPLLGVVNEAQAIKMAWSLLDLGPFDEGGLQNNLPLKMTIWFADALTLHQEKVIRVVSSRLTKYGFQYFRVKKIERRDDLQYDLELQAYPVEYMADFETAVGGGTCAIDADCDPGYICVDGFCVPQTTFCTLDSDCPPGFECVAGECVPRPPCRPGFGAIGYDGQVLQIEVPPC